MNPIELLPEQEDLAHRVHGALFHFQYDAPGQPFVSHIAAGPCSGKSSVFWYLAAILKGYGILWVHPSKQAVQTAKNAATQLALPRNLFDLSDGLEGFRPGRDVLICDTATLFAHSAKVPPAMRMASPPGYIVLIEGDIHHIPTLEGNWAGTIYARQTPLDVDMISSVPGSNDDERQEFFDKFCLFTLPTTPLIERGFLRGDIDLIYWPDAQAMANACENSAKTRVIAGDPKTLGIMPATMQQAAPYSASQAPREEKIQYLETSEIGRTGQVSGFEEAYLFDSSFVAARFTMLCDNTDNLAIHVCGGVGVSAPISANLMSQGFRVTMRDGAATDVACHSRSDAPSTSEDSVVFLSDDALRTALQRMHIPEVDHPKASQQLMLFNLGGEVITADKYFIETLASHSILLKDSGHAILAEWGGDRELATPSIETRYIDTFIQSSIVSKLKVQAQP